MYVHDQYHVHVYNYVIYASYNGEIKNWIELNDLHHLCFRRNFMTVDIFYEQLKFEKVSQVKAYGLLQFFSMFSFYAGFYNSFIVGSIVVLLRINVHVLWLNVSMCVTGRDFGVL